MKICIDAGHNHSGFDTGASANGLQEQNVTFRIASLLKQRLENAGIQIVMTRETATQNLGSSVSTSLSKRAAISNGANCDYFVSIHCNAGGGTGCEVLVLQKGAKAEQLAKSILTELTTRLPLRSRGVKEANLVVLRDTSCPAVLVETAFLDNSADATLLKQNDTVFADAICEGILKHLGISPKTDIAAIKKALSEKWGLSHPEEVFRLLDTHPYHEELYQKIYNSY